MSRTHDIDNDEPVFQFEPCAQLISSVGLEDAARERQSSPSCSPVLQGMSLASLSIDVPQQQEHPSDEMSLADGSSSKGKKVLQPQSAQLPDPQAVEGDMHSLSSGSHSSSRLHETISALSDIDNLSIHSHTLDIDFQGTVTDGLDIGKGKARELPPSLPPLSFSPTELSYENVDWPSFTPSSLGIGLSSYESSSGEGPSRSIDSNSSTAPVPEILIGETRIPLRRNSTSNLSTHSHRSISALSMTKVKVNTQISKGPSNLARKLRFKGRGSGSESPSSPESPSEVINPTISAELDEVGRGSCFMPWAREIKTQAMPILDLDLGLGFVDTMAPAHVIGRSSNNTALRTKGRSYSFPLSISSSPFDVIPIVPADMITPVLAPTTIHFDACLPRELKLHVFAALVQLHEQDYATRVSEGKWTVLKASSSKSKWVGKDKGVRELIKLSRVSKSWQELVFDGQLWSQLNLGSFPHLPAAVLARLSGAAGSFIKNIDLTGHAGLLSSTLSQVTDNLCLRPTLSGEMIQTHLTTINLQGCSALTPQVLHQLLLRSPSLRELCLKGLAAVTNTTFEILVVNCPDLEILDLNRCRNINGDGIYAFAAAALERIEFLPLKTLKLSGLKRTTDDMMFALGRAAPFLEVLDLSYARDLHNSGVEAFVKCLEEDHTTERVRLTSRQAGRDPTDPSNHWRRVTRLRHLSLSACIMLTDHACSHLAHALPKLEFLELAAIGRDLGDSGLVRLLETTPFIRRLDLEDASDITDDVLVAITPSAPGNTPSPRMSAPEPGHALEHLIISYATHVTNDVLMELVCNCTRLRVLEADNTRMSGAVLKEFVQQMRQRGTIDSRVVVVDCRGIGQDVVKALTPQTRPRKGWRSWHARKLAYLDARDNEKLDVGQDECDEKRVVVKTFYSWQTVDEVRAAREKRRKVVSRRATNGSSSSGFDEFLASPISRSRWWSPSGGRRSEIIVPTIDALNDREGCTIM